MALGCGSQFAKIFLFIFNVIFWVVGAAFLAVGIVALTDPKALDLIHVATIESSDSLFRASAITLITLGAIMFAAGFFGCCGACRESSCMLLMYAVIVGMVLFLQVVAGIMAVVFKDEILGELETSMNTTVQSRYGQNGYNTTTDAFDFMQREFKCCGADDGPSEWKTSAWWDNGRVLPQTVPDTCCVLTNKDKTNQAPNPVNATLCYAAASSTNGSYPVEDYLYTKGCKPQLNDWVRHNAGILIGVAFGLAFVQILGIVVACLLRKTITSQYEYV